MMLCNTTTNNKRGENNRLSFVVKMGFALATAMGTFLMIGNVANAQSSDYYNQNSYQNNYQSNRAIDYDGGFNSNVGTFQADYANPADYPAPPANSNRPNYGDYQAPPVNYNQPAYGDYQAPPANNNQPAYGDFQGDRYSPNPTYGSPSQNRSSRNQYQGRRARMNRPLGADVPNSGNYNNSTNYTTRRVPLPDLNDRGLDQASYRQAPKDIRYRDNYDSYQSSVPRGDNSPQYNLPQLPMPNTRLNGNSYPNDYRNGNGNYNYNANYAPSNNNLNDYPPPRPAIQPNQVLPKEELPLAQQIQDHLTYRYGNPVVQRFLYNVSPEQTLNLYREASQLIDTRHLEPTTYQVRTQRAAENLMAGLQNREFLAANRISPSPAQVQTFNGAANQLIQSRPVNSEADAVQMIYAMSNLAYKDVGIRPTTVVLEFVYGSVETLDKYSAFLPEETTKQPSASALDSSVVGIGVEIKPADQGVEVLKVLKGGPAQTGGLQAGDIIVGINGKPLRGQSLDYAVDLIGGPVGSPIYLSVLRNGRQLSPITLTRQEVQILSISDVKMMGQNRDVGYVKLDQFAKTSSDEMDKALWSLQRSGMKSLVIDLRGNPGGLLTTAIALSNKFVPSGTIVSTRGRNPEDNSTEKATATQTWKVPLVVLVDGNSASASEIFAAAIQENGRGVIVGRKSYGKGTVQTHFPLKSVPGNLKLTTAKFYSPKGRQMAGAGVTPDVKVAATSYAGTPTDSDHDVQVAVEVAENGRASNYLASTPQPSYSPGR